MTLPAEDVADLKTCRVGSCELKLGEAALTRLQKEIDWSKATATADVERLFRTFALQYVNGYLEGGNERLAVYRDSDRPTFVAQEFASLIERMPPLTDLLPDLKRYLLGYPKMTLPNAESFLYLAERQVRPEAHHPDQPRDDGETTGGRGRGLEDVVRHPLFLDGDRAARSRPRSRARRRILVRHCKP